MAPSAWRSVPSIARRGPCQLGLKNTSIDEWMSRDEGVGMVSTKANSRVLLPHVVALLIGKEHVGRKTTLGRVGI